MAVNKPGVLDETFGTEMEKLIGAVKMISPNQPQIAVHIETGATVLAAKSGVSKSAVSVNGIAVIDVNSTGVWHLTATKTGSVFLPTEVHVTENKVYEVTMSKTDIFGASWDKSSSPVLTRTDGAVGFANPVPYVLGATEYGSPFDEFYPWSEMRVVQDETLGDLVEIPKFYYKITNTDSEFKVQISATPQAGYLVSPAHSDRGDGKGVRDKVYIGRYHCDNDYKSLGGTLPKVSMARATARSSIHALGSDVWQMDYAMRMTIWMLYIVEFAHFDSQAKIGYGCGNGSSKENQGASDAMPYHTGTMQASRTTYGVGVQYRFIEGLWDNCYDWCDGIYFSGADVYGILNPANFSDAANGVLIGQRPTTDGYIKFLFVPTEAGYEGFMYCGEIGGGSTTYFCDYCYQGGTVLYVGGGYGQSTHRGLLYLVGGYGASSADAGIGCRLQKLP